MDWITQNFEEAVQPSMSNSSPGRKKIDFSTSFILLSTHNIYVSGDGSQGKLKTWEYTLDFSMFFSNVF